MRRSLSDICALKNLGKRFLKGENVFRQVTTINTQILKIHSIEYSSNEQKKMLIIHQNKRFEFRFEKKSYLYT